MKGQVLGIPSVIYNAEKQQLVAIFKSRELLQKFALPSSARGGVINSYIRSKSRALSRTTGLPFDAAFRTANAQQVALLGELPYILYDETLKHRL